MRLFCLTQPIRLLFSGVVIIMSLPFCLLKAIMQTIIALLIKYADFCRSSSLPCCHCLSSLFKKETVWSGVSHLTKQLEERAKSRNARFQTRIALSFMLFICLFSTNRISGSILPMEMHQMAALSQQNHVRPGGQRILQSLLVIR